MSSKTPIRHEYGHNLMLLREARQLTIPEACMSLNMSRAAWEGWEKATSFPGPHNMIRIARFFQFYDIYAMTTREFTMKEIKAAVFQNVKNQ